MAGFQSRAARLGARPGAARFQNLSGGVGGAPVSRGRQRHSHNIASTYVRQRSPRLSAAQAIAERTTERTTKRAVGQAAGQAVKRTTKRAVRQAAGHALWRLETEGWR
jgi:hypothetical protein